MDEYHDWQIKTSHATLEQAYKAGAISMKAKVVSMLRQQELLNADPSISKIADAVLEL